MQKDNKELLAAFNKSATIGFYLVSSIVSGILLGKLIDGYFGSQPLATIVGIVLGMIAGLWVTYKKVVGVK